MDSLEKAESLSGGQLDIKAIFESSDEPLKVPLSRHTPKACLRREPEGEEQTEVDDFHYQATAGWDYGGNEIAVIQPGAAVYFHSLQFATELNGQQGIVVRLDEESGRWVVKLSNGEEKFTKQDNLSCVGTADAYSYDSYYWGACIQPYPGMGLDMGCASFGSAASTAAGSSKLTASFSSQDDEGVEPRTTVMMRNLPNTYSRDLLMELLLSAGFQGAYNLIYLPIDFNTGYGFGYAFINFVSTEEAHRFFERFHGFHDWDFDSKKICEVAWSDALQGIRDHIERYRNSPVMHPSVPDEFKPMLFMNGVRVPFPASTRKIRAPRIRARFIAGNKGGKKPPAT